MVRQLPADIAADPYEADAWVLVRPDGIIACWGNDPGNPPDLAELSRYLPN